MSSIPANTMSQKAWRVGAALCAVFFLGAGAFSLASSPALLRAQTSPQPPAQAASEKAPAPPVPKPIWPAPFVAVGPVARVDGAPVEAKEFNEAAHALAQAMRGMTPPQMLGMYQEQLLERRIDAHLLARGIARAKISISEQEVSAALTQHLEQDVTLKTYEQYLLDEQLTDEQVRARARAQLERERFVLTTGKITITQELLRQRYDQTPEAHITPAVLDLSQILFALGRDATAEQEAKARARAVSVREAIEQGTAFAQAARSHSDDASKQSGGKIKGVVRGRLPEPLFESALEAQAGEVIGPLRTHQGWHLVRLERKIAARQESFEEVEEALRRELRERRMREVLHIYLARERARSKIERLPQNIQLQPQTLWRQDPSAFPL